MTIGFTKLTSVRVLCLVVCIFVVVGGRVMGSWAIIYPGDGFFEVFAISGFVFSGISWEMLTQPNTIGQICDKRQLLFSGNGRFASRAGAACDTSRNSSVAWS